MAEIPRSKNEKSNFPSKEVSVDELEVNHCSKCADDVAVEAITNIVSEILTPQVPLLIGPPTTDSREPPSLETNYVSSQSNNDGKDFSPNINEEPKAMKDDFLRTSNDGSTEQATRTLLGRQNAESYSRREKCASIAGVSRKRRK